MTNRERVWTGVAIVAFGGTFGLAEPIAAYRGGLTAADVIEIAKLLVSWPVAALCIALLVTRRFSDPIAALLARGGWKFDAFGTKIESQLLQSQTSSDVPVALSPKAAAAEDNGAATTTNLSPGASAIAPVSGEAAKFLEKPSKDTAWHWKMLYLNLFFVPRTKYVLDWIGREGRISKDKLHEVLVALRVEPQEEIRIATALLTTGVIQDDGDSFAITAEGRLFAISQRMFPASWLNAPPPESVLTVPVAS